MCAFVFTRLGRFVKGAVTDQQELLQGTKREGTSGTGMMAGRRAGGGENSAGRSTSFYKSVSPPPPFLAPFFV
jgi:hypothetical protein